MGHFRSDLRDVEFDLFEVFRVQDGPAGPDVDTDPDTLRDLLRELDRLATGPLAEGYADADRHPPVFDPATHTVTLPEPVKRAYRLLWEGEWWRLGLPAELGGLGVPATVQWAAAELILAANPAVYLYLGGPRFASIVHRLGTREQRRWAELMIERGWGATMVLTEPDAGSDVGAGRTRAVPQPDGTWHLDGVKRFITSAEHDLTENIVHLVLARPEGPGITPQPGHEGAVAVPRAEAPVRPGHRRAGRAQRRVRHERRAQDGPQGVRDLRAHVRPSTASPRWATCSARCTTASRRCSR